MRQRNTIVSLVLMNVIVYGVLGYCLLVLGPAQEQSRAPSLAVALANQVGPTNTPMPAATSVPSATPLPTDTLTPTPTDTPTGTAPPAIPIDLNSSAGPMATPTITRTPTRATAATAARKSRPALIALPTRTPTRPPAAAVPTGDSPGTALLPNGLWQALAPGASVWYRVGGPGEKIDVFLEGKPLSNMRMEVFAPGNSNRPIGRGSMEPALNRLVWSGGHWASWGDWFAHIFNSGPGAAQYHVATITRVIGTCEAISYWEWIGPNLVYWTRCK